MRRKKFKILVAALEPEIRSLLADALCGLFDTYIARDERQAERMLKSGAYSLAFIGEKLLKPDPAGLLSTVLDDDISSTAVAILSTPDPALEAKAVKAGAETVIRYPFSAHLVRAVAHKAKDDFERWGDIRRLLESIIVRLRSAAGCDAPGMEPVNAWLDNAAENDSPLIIVGERGLRKPLLAQIIHLNSDRSMKPFIQVKTGDAGRDDMEKTLFGDSSSPGAIERAKGGAVLIRGAANLPSHIQENIMALIKQGAASRGPRFMFTTRTDLHGAALRGEFNPDLHAALERQSIHAPPLRDRPEAIVEIAGGLITKYGELLGSAAASFHRSARELLAAYSWPGNIAQLEKIVVLAMSRATGRLLTAKDMPELSGFSDAESIDRLSLEEILSHKLEPLVDTIDELGDADLHELIISRVERPLIRLVMEKTGNNRIRAARALGIHRNTLRKKLRRLGIKTEGP